ncbi:hypothetical protein JKP88DRAFT_223260 [Tribonema minus]|uniref:Uncharacterized protein n=1 Tax=Tribonema minus TaxID=303371 RepID=A0A836CCG0_9STRA|nr:hypothetical protein JKP88DRAFT_223260 [Tribonema minus]
MHVLPSWDAFKLMKAGLPSGKRLRRHLSTNSCASTESGSSSSSSNSHRPRHLSESEDSSSDSEAPRQAKRVSFNERVGVILIPAKEELDARSIWWSARELQAIRKAFYAHVAGLVQQQHHQHQLQLQVPQLVAASQPASMPWVPVMDSLVRIPEDTFTAARSPAAAPQRAASHQPAVQVP